MGIVLISRNSTEGEVSGRGIGDSWKDTFEELEARVDWSMPSFGFSDPV